MSLACRHMSVVISLAALACGGHPTKTPIACQSDPDCPTEAKCVLGACVAGSLPQAKIVVRAGQGELISNRLITFDGSLSQDTNPGGTVRRYAWAVSHAPGTACDPSVRSGEKPSFSTIFQCSGQYAVELKVTNDVGLDSLPERAEITIAQALDAPAITAVGAGVTAAHRCEGSPLVCRAFDVANQSTFQLAVSASDEQDGTGLGYAWTYRAPPGVDAAKTRVVFDPHPNTPTPSVRIETDGTAIAGDWIFQAQVTDSDQLTTFAEQKLTIENSAPVAGLQGPTVILAHTFLAPVDRYVASATLRAVASDPDGDPITGGELSIVEVESNACSFQVTSSDLAAGQFTAKVELSCPGAGAKDLIGSIARQLVFKATDANGAVATDVKPLEVSNAAPVLAWAGGGTAGTYAVPHAVVPCPPGAPTPSCFAVDAANPYTVSDAPENDPVALALTGSAVPAGTYLTTSADGRHFTWLVPMNQASVFRSASGSSALGLQVTASDPFTGASPSTASFGLSVANSTPTVTAAGGVVAAHWYSTADRAYHATFSLGAAADADGDPLVPSAVSSDGACSAVGIVAGQIQVGCTWPWDFAAGGVPLLWNPYFTTRTGRTWATDPWSSSPATPPTPVAISNNSPVMKNQPASLSAIGGCVCHVAVSSWAPNGPGDVSYNPGAADADQDPLHLTITFASGAPAIDKVCFGADCAVTCGSVNDTATVTLSDGVLDATRTVGIVRTCDESLPCGPPRSGICP